MHPEDAPALKPLSPAARKWVEETFAKLTIDEKIGQVVFPTYFGGFESAQSHEFKELMARVEENHIGGFILATRRGPRGIELSHVYETAVLTNQLQDAAKIPLLVGADFERGTVMRVEEGTAFPHAMAVGATGRPEDAYTMGRVTSIEARAIGVHWAFAPVADVNSNPDNPIINIRSFGEDPKRVAEYVAQFVKGVEDNGAMATAKHVPGHGDTSVDSHLELPLVKADRARLNALEFIPFEAAIGAGVSSIMTAHLAVPALEPSPDTPATLSQRVLTGVLRDDLHFGGLVITDALDMGGVTKGFPPGEVAVRALLAGADVLLMSPVTDAALASVRYAVQSGRLPMSRLDEAVHKLLEAKARLGLYQSKEVDIEKVNEAFRKPEFLAAAQDIADRGITLLRNDKSLVPLDPRTTKRIFLLAVSADPDTTPAEPFERELRSQLDSLDSLHVDTKYFRVEETHLPSPDTYDLAICALTVRVADRKASVGLPPNQAELVHSLLRAGKPVIMVGLGSPYLVEGFPEAATWLSAFSVQDVAQKAAARALLGQIAVSGSLPVSLPSASPRALHVGEGMTTAPIPLTLQAASPELQKRLTPAFDSIDALVKSKHPAAGWLIVGHRGEQAIHKISVVPPPAQGFGISVTKTGLAAIFRDQPVLTTTIARLVQVKQLSLDTPLAVALQGAALEPPEGGWRGLTVRQLLEGTSGLEVLHDGQEERQPGRVRLGFAAAARPRGSSWEADGVVQTALLSTLTGEKYEDAVNGMIFQPLGVELSRPAASVSGPRAGQVPDEATALSVVAQLWLNRGIYAHVRLFGAAVSEQFLARRREKGEVFTAGWDALPAPSQSLSPAAYGHTEGGWQSVWIDPERDLYVVLLLDATRPLTEDAGKTTPPDTNREELRAKIHDAVCGALAPRK